MDKKIALIIGATSGIGYHLTLEVAKKGYKVVGIDIINGNYKNKEIDFYIADLRDEQAVKLVFNDIMKKYGMIHLLINKGENSVKDGWMTKKMIYQ